MALVDAQSAARGRVRDSVLTAVRNILARFAGRWYDEAATRGAGVEVTRIVRQGQVMTGDVTGAYLDQVLALLGVARPRGGVVLPDRLRGVDPAVEWARPASQYRRARLAGVDDLLAQEAAVQRAELMASMDLSLAMREAARQRLASVDSITGYRRVIHPERSASGTCGLCVAASDRVYHKRDLLPLHDGCWCETLPIVTGRADPGRSLNTAELRSLYGAAGGTSRSALKTVRVKAVDHGELGPVLVDATHRFRDPAAAAADVRAATA